MLGWLCIRFPWEFFSDDCLVFRVWRADIDPLLLGCVYLHHVKTAMVGT